MDKTRTDNKLFYIILIVAMLSLLVGLVGLFIRPSSTPSASQTSASQGTPLPNGSTGSVVPQSTPDGNSPSGNVYRN